MKITCAICNSRLEVNLLVVPPEGDIRGHCPSCDATYVVRPSQKTFDVPSIKFFASDRAERTCIRCSKTFLEKPQVAIPICEECSEVRPEAEVETPSAWHVEKTDGSVYGPYTLTELSGLIGDRIFAPNDMGINPSGSRMPLIDFKELSRLFEKKKKPFKPIPVKKQDAPGQPARRIRRRGFGFRLWMLFSLAVVAALLLMMTFAGQQPSPDVEKIRHLLADFDTKQTKITKADVQLALRQLAQGTSEGNTAAARTYLAGYLTAKRKAADNMLARFLEATAELPLLPNEASTLQSRLDLAQDLVSRLPDNAIALRALGLLQEQNHQSAAKENFEQALALNEDDRRSRFFALRQQSRRMREQQDYDIEKDPWLKWAMTNTAYPAAFLQSAQLLLEQVQPAAALKQIERYLKIFPRSWQAMLIHARIFLQSGEMDQALRDLEAVLVLNPENRPARWLYLELALEKRIGANKVIPTLDYLDQNVASTERDRLEELKVRSDLTYNRFPEALARLEDSAKGRLNRYWRSRIYLANSMPAQALQELGETDAQSTVDESLLRGRILQQLGQLERARVTWKDLLEKEPHNLEAYLELFFSFWQAGKRAQALTELSAAFGKVGFDVRSLPSFYALAKLSKIKTLLGAAGNVSQHAKLPLARGLVSYLLASASGTPQLLRRAEKQLQLVIRKQRESESSALLYIARLRFLAGDYPPAVDTLAKINTEYVSAMAYHYNAALLYAAISSSQAHTHALALTPEKFPQYLIDYAIGLSLLASGERREAVKKLQASLQQEADFRPAFWALLQLEVDDA